MKINDILKSTFKTTYTYTIQYIELINGYLNEVSRSVWHLRFLCNYNVYNLLFACRNMQDNDERLPFVESGF